MLSNAEILLILFICGFAVVTILLLQKVFSQQKQISREESFKSLFENQHEAWIIFDAESLYALKANQKALNLFGLYRQRNLNKLSFKNIFREPLSDDEVQLLYSAIDQETFMNRSLQCSGLGGRSFKAAVSINRVYNGNLFCRFAEFPFRVEVAEKTLPVYESDLKMEKDAEPYKAKESSMSLENKAAIPLPINTETLVNDQLIESEDFALAWLNDEQKFIRANEMLASLTGYSSDELKLLHFTDLTYEAPHIEDKHKLEHLFNGKIVFYAEECTLIRKNREKITVRCEAMMTLHKGIVLLKMEDITQQKTLERELVYTRDNLYAVVEHTTEAIFAVDALDKITVLNTVYKDRFFEKYGVWLKNGMRYGDSLPKEERAAWRNTLTAVLRGKTITSTERLVNQQGKEEHYELALHPVYSGENKLITGVSYFSSNITLHIEQENELRNAKEIAEKATTVKSRFLATMSHELRTPLNGIIGMAELLRTSKLDQDQQQLLNKIRVSGDALLQVINEVLDFSHIEADKMRLESKPFLLKQLVNETVDILSLKAQEKNLTVKMRIDPLLPQTFIGDKSRLRQVLVNLLGNAIKFTSEGFVSVEVRPSETIKTDKNKNMLLEFSVKDTGIGMSAQQKSKLFQEYAQADSATFGKYGGTGLGLAISQRIIEMMGGTIQVNSDIGKGSHFYFAIELPVNNNLSNDLLVNEAIYKADQQLAENYPMDILVAEDNDVNQLLMINILKQFGYQVDSASTGYQVLEKLKSKKYDLVFMDVQMPEMDGIEATKEIIRTYGQQHPVIISMTGFTTDDDKQQCLDAGMNDYLSKPILIEDLQRMIKKWNSVEKVRKIKEKSVSSSELNVNTNNFIVEDSISKLDLIDIAAIQRLRDIAAKTDTAFVNQVILLFEKQVPTGISEIETAFNKSDYNGIFQAAHKLKGTCMNIGAKQLSELFRFLEMKGKNNDSRKLKENVELLRPLYEKTLSVFRKELSGDPD